MTMNTANLDRAIKLLGARRLPDGRFAYYADEADRYYLVTAEQAAALCRYVDDDAAVADNGAYSLWCANEGAVAEEMPAGWTPSSRPVAR
jgi:hypothetical protein